MWGFFHMSAIDPEVLSECRSSKLAGCSLLAIPQLHSNFGGPAETAKEHDLATISQYLMLGKVPAEPEPG